VVHEGDQAHVRVVGEPGERVEAVLARDFAADVDRVIGAQQAAVGCQLDRVRQAPGGLGSGIVLACPGADAHRVEHGGRASGRQLRVTGENSVQRIPLHARPRDEVVLEVVGMQLDHARQQVVAAQVLGDRGSTGADVGDQAVTDQDRAVRDLLPAHDAAIAQDGFARHRVLR
jgi:hypothetical protein